MEYPISPDFHQSQLMIHTDINTDMTCILIRIPGIFTNDIPGIGIGIRNIPIVELIPIAILDKVKHRRQHHY